MGSGFGTSGSGDSKEDESGGEGSEEDGSGVDGSSSGAGMSSFFLTNLI